MIYTEYEMESEQQPQSISPEAAQDLLEACKTVVTDALDENGCNWCDTVSHRGHENWCPIPEVLAAIAKAEGD